MSHNSRFINFCLGVKLMVTPPWNPSGVASPPSQSPAWEHICHFAVSSQCNLLVWDVDHLHRNPLITPHRGDYSVHQNIPRHGFKVVGSIVMVFPGEETACLGNLPHTRSSVFGRRVTACVSLTVLIFPVTSWYLYLVRFVIISKNCSHSWVLFPSFDHSTLFIHIPHLVQQVLDDIWSHLNNQGGNHIYITDL